MFTMSSAWLPAPRSAVPTPLKLTAVVSPVVPEGIPLFGATFFGTTGLHMLHVSIGVLYLLFMAAGISRNKFTADDVEVSGLYWHFVDLVWMFVFPLIYLMSIRL